MAFLLWSVVTRLVSVRRCPTDRWSKNNASTGQQLHVMHCTGSCINISAHKLRHCADGVCSHTTWSVWCLCPGLWRYAEASARLRPVDHNNMQLNRVMQMSAFRSRSVSIHRYKLCWTTSHLSWKTRVPTDYRLNFVWLFRHARLYSSFAWLYFLFLCLLFYTFTSASVLA